MIQSGKSPIFPVTPVVPLLCYWCMIMVLLAAIGCSNTTSEGLHISGTVAFDGQPVPYGRIEFMPEPVQPNQVPVGYAVVCEGKFDTRKEGQAVKKGLNVVRIYGFEAEAGQVPAMEDRVPLFNEFETREEIKPEQLEYSFEVPGRSR